MTAGTLPDWAWAVAVVDMVSEPGLVGLGRLQLVDRDGMLFVVIPNAGEVKVDPALEVLAAQHSVLAGALTVTADEWSLLVGGGADGPSAEAALQDTIRDRWVANIGEPAAAARCAVAAGNQETYIRAAYITLPEVP